MSQQSLIIFDIGRDEVETNQFPNMPISLPVISVMIWRDDRSTFDMTGQGQGFLLSFSRILVLLLIWKSDEKQEQDRNQGLTRQWLNTTEFPFSIRTLREFGWNIYVLSP